MLAHGRWSFEGEGWGGPLLRRVVGVGVERQGRSVASPCPHFPLPPSSAATLRSWLDGGLPLQGVSVSVYMFARSAFCEFKIA